MTSDDPSSNNTGVHSNLSKDNNSSSSFNTNTIKDETPKPKKCEVFSLKDVENQLKTENSKIDASKKSPSRSIVPEETFKKVIQEQRKLMQKIEDKKREFDSKFENVGKLSDNILPFYYRFLFSPDGKRADGRWANSTKILVRAGEKSDKVAEANFVILFYNLIMGAIGGVAVGVETGYFAFTRLPAPNVLLPIKMERTRTCIQYTLAGGSVSWRIAKRAVVGGLLFDLLDKNFEEFTGEKRWTNSAMAGAFCGTIFGLRGGIGSTIAGFLGFGALGGIAGFYSNMK